MGFRVDSSMSREEIRKLLKDLSLYLSENTKLTETNLNFTANKVIHQLKQKNAEEVMVRGTVSEEDLAKFLDRVLSDYK